MTESKLGAAIALARAGRRRQARDLFLEIVEQNEENELAWLWLADLVDDVDDQIIALENVLTLNPENQRARARLESLRQMDEDPGPSPAAPTGGDEKPEEAPARTLLATARWHEQQGRLEEAAVFYEQAQALSETQRERQLAGKRLRNVERRLELGQPVPANSTFTLVRLSIGPLLLYLLLLFIHAAYRPWRLSPLLCLGTLPVLAGSVLLVGTRVTAAHPWWRRLFDGQRLQPGARALLALLGLLLLALPYLLFLLLAYKRLNP